jgi:hypothetical protein
MSFKDKDDVFDARLFLKCKINVTMFFIKKILHLLFDATTIGQTAIGQTAIDQAAIDQAAISQTAIGQMAIVQMAISKTAIGLTAKWPSV